jgi:hypothetical protein
MEHKRERQVKTDHWLWVTQNIHPEPIRSGLAYGNTIVDLRAGPKLVLHTTAEVTPNRDALRAPFQIAE